jgi:hypothetical protein
MLLLAACTWPGVAVEASCEDDVRALADRFGAALVGSEASALRSLLPARGKVQLSLHRLGPERGHFSGNQVEAVFAAYLSEGAVDAFEVQALECDRDTSALVRTRATLRPGRGREEKVDLHLGFRPEDGAWVLREVREIAP